MFRGMTDFKCFTPQKAYKKACSINHRQSKTVKSMPVHFKKLQLLPILQNLFQSHVLKRYRSAKAQGSCITADLREHPAFFPINTVYI